MKVIKKYAVYKMHDTWSEVRLKLLDQPFDSEIEAEEYMENYLQEKTNFGPLVIIEQFTNSINHDQQ